MNKQRKKLLVIGSSQGHYGGIEAFMIALANSSIKDNELEVKLCFKLVNGATLKNDLKAACETLNIPVYFIKRASRDLFKLVRWSDVLHVQNTPPDVIFPARLLGKKILLTIHNWKRKNKNFHNLIWSFAIRLVHKKWFISHFVWKTWEVPGASAKSECVPTICRLPDTWCEPENRKGFLFIGRWIQNKGIEELLHAYAINNFDPVKHPLTILGDGPLRAEVLALIKKLNITHVHIPGFVEDQKKYNYLASSKWLLAPAKTKEDLGLTPIEARSVGVPSIVTNDGGLPEAGGEAAIIAIPDDVNDLARCLKVAAAMNEKEYSRRSEIAKNSLKNFLRPMEFYINAYKN